MERLLRICVLPLVTRLFWALRELMDRTTKGPPPDKLGRMFMKFNLTLGFLKSPESVVAPIAVSNSIPAHRRGCSVLDSDVDPGDCNDTTRREKMAFVITGEFWGEES